MNCAASLVLGRYMDGDDDSVHSVTGTAAHAIAAHCQNERIDPFMVLDLPKDERGKFVDFPTEAAGKLGILGDLVSDQGWRDLVDNVTEFVTDGLQLMNSGWQVWIEEKVCASSIDDRIWGTADRIAWHPGLKFLKIDDYKNGFGYVNEVRNKQMGIYAQAAIDTLGLNPETVTTMVYQPNAVGHASKRHHAWSVAERRELSIDLKTAILAHEEDPYPVPNPGKWCVFCKAKGICPKFKEVGDDVIKESGGLKAPFSMSDADLAHARALLPKLRMWVKEVDQRVYARLMAGASPEKVGGKIVMGRKNRVMKPGGEEAAVEKFGEGAYEKKILSPARLDKLPLGKVFTKEWCYTPPGEPRLVALDDPGMHKLPSTAERLDKLKPS